MPTLIYPDSLFHLFRAFRPLLNCSLLSLLYTLRPFFMEFCTRSPNPSTPFLGFVVQEQIERQFKRFSP